MPGILLFCLFLIACQRQQIWLPQHVIAATVYPPLANAARIQGLVELKCHPKADGTMESCQAEGSPILCQAAIENVKTWKFAPAAPNASTPQQISLHYRFELKGKPTRDRPSAIFSFDFPDTATLTAQPTCPDHLPCGD